MENNTSALNVSIEVTQPWHVAISSVTMCILSLTTILGNIFVIASVFTYRPLRIVPNFFIVSLAFADMLVALIVMPFHISNNIIGHWIYGEALCKLWLTFDVLLCTSSILNLCIIALDRYWAIHDPLAYAQKRTVKRVLIMIFAGWFLSAGISIPPVFGWGDSAAERLYNYETKACRLTSEKGYVVYSACGSFYIPLCVMSFVYLKIYLATQKRLRQRTQAAAATKLAMLNNKTDTTNTADTKQRNHSESTNDGEDESTVTDKSKSEKSQKTSPPPQPKLKPKSSKKGLKNAARNGRMRNSMQSFFEEKQRISLSKERKAARTLAIIMVTFVLCWIPFFLMYIILPFCSSCTVHPIVEMFFVWLGYLNSTLNPIIYTIFNTEFRKAFNDMVGRCCKKQTVRGFMTRSYV